MRVAAGRRRFGFTLIETVAALAIVGVGAFTILSIGIACSRAVTSVSARERHVESAQTLMQIVTLWPRTDLDRHLGDRQEGNFVLTVQVITPNVYELSIRDSVNAAPLLVTSTYRRSPQ